jgi:hypothetical protein
MRFSQVKHGGIGWKIRRRNAEPGENLFYFKAIHRAQGVQTVDGWYGALVFDVRQPAQRDGELIAAPDFGEAQCEFLYVTVCEAELLPYPLEFLSRIPHDGMFQAGL